MSKIPIWLKIVVPMLLLGVLFVAVAGKVWFEQVPEQAQADVIQERFAEQIAVLEELALTVPAEICADQEEPSLEDAQEIISTLRAWLASFEPQKELFADPAILGVKVFRTCDGSQIHYSIKDYDALVPRFSRSMVTPPTTWPAVSLWFAGSTRLVKYEDRTDAGSGEITGFELTLDPEHL